MNRNKIISLFAACCFICIATAALAAEKSRLDVIIERGYILVGTTGDYKPFKREWGHSRQAKAILL